MSLINLLVILDFELYFYELEYRSIRYNNEYKRIMINIYIKWWYLVLFFYVKNILYYLKYLIFYYMYYYI